MCDDRGFASGWEVMIAARRFQHRVEVFMDQSLEHLGMTYAQYRALEALTASKEMPVSELARRLRVSRQAARSTIAKLDRGWLVDAVRENGRLYVGPSELGRRRLQLCRSFTEDFKLQLEGDLSHGERHRLVMLLERAGRALEPAPPHRPEWWLAP
jgi:DNA-binding MarR family transcriptional regulator